MIKKYICLAIAAILIIGCFAGCNKTDPAGTTPTVAPTAMGTEIPDAEKTVLTVAGAWEDCRAIEAVGRAFTAENPNCIIEYEYLQDYYTSLTKRFTGENAIDIFFTTNIQADSEMLPYAFDLNSRDDMDLSQTFEGLINNFSFREDPAPEKSKIYALPLGAEMRGLYVNKTLLDSVGLSVPTDQESLLAACATLKEKGFIPFHGNPGIFGQTLLYPWICNSIANADDPDAMRAQIEAREPGVSELFRDQFAFLYTLVENYYYDYKTAQTELNLFNDSTDKDYARYFLNIVPNGEEFEKADDVGIVAFMPASMSLQGVIDKTKDDYHSEIEYVFIPAPVSPEGGFAYMSPAHGIAVNNASNNLDMSVKFMNFLFQPENNELFAAEFNIIPNTAEAFAYISSLYDIPAERISHLGQVTFSYDFYNILVEFLVDTSKANNPKYMNTEADGTVSLFPLDYYMNLLEESFTANEQ